MRCFFRTAWLLSSSIAGVAGCAPRAPDAPTPEVVAAPTSAPQTAAHASPPPAFACTLVLGLAVTGEWYRAGFERAVDDARYELLVKPHTFVRNWADPADAVWTQELESPCSEHAARPDRVLFFVADWKYPDEAAWVAGLNAAVSTIRAKYPSVRELELLTMFRGPGNASCGDPKSAVDAMVDRAVTQVVGAAGGVAQAGPRFEVSGCDAFSKGGPHFSETGAVAAAQLVAAHYRAP